MRWNDCLEIAANFLTPKPSALQAANSVMSDRRAAWDIGLFPRADLDLPKDEEMLLYVALVAAMHC